MTTYTQNKVVFAGDNGGPSGWNLLTPLYVLTRRAPGCSLVFTGVTPRDSRWAMMFPSIVVTIPSSPVGFTDADIAGSSVGHFMSWHRPGGGYWLETDPQYRVSYWKEQRRLADILFSMGNTITIASDHYSVYSHANDLLFRPTATHQAYGLLVPGAIDYVAPP